MSVLRRCLKAFLFRHSFPWLFPTTFVVPVQWHFDSHNFRTLKSFYLLTCRFVEEIQRRRDIGAARAAANHQRSLSKRTSQNEANALVRVTAWTLVGAFSFVAYTLFRSGGRLEWPSSWWWWLWTPTQAPPGFGTWISGIHCTYVMWGSGTCVF